MIRVGTIASFTVLVASAVACGGQAVAHDDSAPSMPQAQATPAEAAPTTVFADVIDLPGAPVGWEKSGYDWPPKKTPKGCTYAGSTQGKFNVVVEVLDDKGNAVIDPVSGKPKTKTINVAGAKFVCTTEKNGPDQIIQLVTGTPQKPKITNKTIKTKIITTHTYIQYMSGGKVHVYEPPTQSGQFPKATFADLGGGDEGATCGLTTVESETSEFTETTVLCDEQDFTCPAIATANAISFDQVGVAARTPVLAGETTALEPATVTTCVMPIPNGTCTPGTTTDNKVTTNESMPEPCDSGDAAPGL